MSLDLKSQLLQATNGGLDIILKYYPQAAETLHSSNKKFKVRDGERTASTSLKQLKDGNWVVTDFGGDQVPRNGIQICAQEENLNFREALVKLCGDYRIGHIKQELNKPGFEKRDAKPDEKEGEYFFDTNDKLSKKELELLGPAVTQEVCDRYHFYSLKSFTYIKNRKATTTIATETYPIFLIDHDSWKKIYQPLSFDKGYRFRYVGSKPKDLINGLDILQKENAKFETKQLNEIERLELSGEKNIDKRIKKYPEAILCSGERDALNLAGFGYIPIWLNSETAGLTGSQYGSIRKCCEDFYILPDIDKTGLKAATELCLKYLDLKLILLPNKLKTFNDSRGNFRKDFRDYLDLTDKRKDFQKLMDVAMPMQFWDTNYSDKTGVKYFFMPSQAFQFLQSNGFWKIENKNTKEGEEFIRIEGNVVTPIKSNDIKGFMFKFCKDRFLPIPLRDMLHSTTKLNDTSLAALERIELDFKDFDEQSQHIFFKNKTIKVSGNDIMAMSNGDGDKFVWNEEVIDHNFKKIEEPPFIIDRNPDSGEYDIKVKDISSKFFGYLINASRVYWREELEVRVNGVSDEDQRKYEQENKFNIAGPRLMDEEKEIQKKHLINKIFAIGYLLHRHKNVSKPWAVWATDNKISPEGESHGRSGKSFCFKAVKMFMKTVTLPGRNPKLTDNPHMMDRVTEHTDMIIVDDADQYLNFKVFFDSITGELIVNPKNNQSYEIPFEQSPKFVFTSNFVLKNVDPSTEARLIYTVFSDYYHEKGENDEYRETRKISDSFGKNLFGADYTTDEWNYDFNFFAHCLRFYLSVKGTEKINAPMSTVTKRQLLTTMGQQFKDWADVYLGKDELVVRRVAMEDFSKQTNIHKWSTNKFTKAVKAWAQYYGYDYNPACLQNSSGRIVRKYEDKSEDMIFIQTQQVDPTLLSDEALQENEKDQDSQMNLYEDSKPF